MLNKMKTKKILLGLISAFVFFFFSARYSHAVELKGYINYDQYSSMEECDKFKAEWTSCTVPPGCHYYDPETYRKNQYDPQRNAELCYMQMAIKDRNIDICLKKYEGNQYLTGAECISQLAIVENNSSLCERIDEINIPVEYSGKNVAILDSNRDTMKNGCFRDFAKYTGDISTCEKVHSLEPEKYVDICYSDGLEGAISIKNDQIPKNPELCNKMPDFKQFSDLHRGYYRDRCFAFALDELMQNKLAEYLVKNIGTCEQFPNSSDKTVCYKKSYENLMKPDFSEYLSSNPEVCENFLNEKKEKCYETSLAGLFSMEKGDYIAKNADSCLRFPEQERKKCIETSYSNLNEKKFGNMYCKKFPGISGKVNIGQMIIARLGGKFGVEKESITKEECYYNLGFLKEGEKSELLNKRHTVAFIILLVEILVNGIILFLTIKNRHIGFSILSLAYPAMIFIIYSFILNRQIWIDVSLVYTLTFNISIVYFFVALIIFIMILARKKEAAVEN